MYGKPRGTPVEWGSDIPKGQRLRTRAAYLERGSPRRNSSRILSSRALRVIELRCDIASRRQGEPFASNELSIPFVVLKRVLRVTRTSERLCYELR